MGFLRRIFRGSKEPDVWENRYEKYIKFYITQATKDRPGIKDDIKVCYDVDIEIGEGKSRGKLGLFSSRPFLSTEDDVAEHIHKYLERLRQYGPVEYEIIQDGKLVSEITTRVLNAEQATRLREKINDLERKSVEV